VFEFLIGVLSIVPSLAFFAGCAGLLALVLRTTRRYLGEPR
jgi:hypothetical protein